MQAFWTQRQKELSDAITAALATESDASKHAAMTITVDIPLSTAPAGTPFHNKPAPISVSVKGDHVHVLTSDESKLGSIAPDALFKVSADIDDWLLSRLSSDSLRRQYRTQSDGCGLLLVRVFLTKVAVYAVAHGDAFETQLLSHVRRGIQSLSSEAYLHFKSFVEIYNAALPTDRIRSDSQIASILEEAAKGLTTLALSSTARRLGPASLRRNARTRPKSLSISAVSSQFPPSTVESMLSRSLALPLTLRHSYPAVLSRAPRSPCRRPGDSHPVRRQPHRGTLPLRQRRRIHIS